MRKKVDEHVDEINPYEVDKLSKIPTIVKVVFVKYWAAAAAVFFILIGGLDVGLDFSELDSENLIGMINLSQKIIVLLGFGLFILNNYVVKQIILIMNNRRNNAIRYNMVNSTGLIGFAIGLIYFMFVSLVLFFVTLLLSKWGIVLDLFGTTGGSGIEPFTYGLCFIIIDELLVLFKNCIIKIAQRINYYKEIRRA